MKRALNFLLFLLLSPILILAQNSVQDATKAFSFSFGVAQYDGDLGSEIIKLTRKQSYHFGIGYSFLFNPSSQLNVKFHHSRLDYRYQSFRDQNFRRPPVGKESFDTNSLLFQPTFRRISKKPYHLNEINFYPFAELGLFLSRIQPDAENDAYFSGGLSSGLGIEFDLNSLSRLSVGLDYHWLQFGPNKDALESVSESLRLDQAAQDEFLHLSLGVKRYFGSKKSRSKKPTPLTSKPILVEPSYQVIDSDKDGIIDNLDLCPNLFGSKTANGCPDADQDGLADAVDLCPNLYGKDYGGCPDLDKDHIIDTEDECPNIKGIPSLSGCSTMNVFFELGSSELNSSYLARLQKVALEARSMGSFKVLLKGHTDDTGTQKFNELLALQRAFAVQKEMIKYGLELENISIDSAGELLPIVPNNSTLNRAKNRRVQIEIQFLNDY